MSDNIFPSPLRQGTNIQQDLEQPKFERKCKGCMQVTLGPTLSHKSQLSTIAKSLGLPDTKQKCSTKS